MVDVDLSIQAADTFGPPITLTVPALDADGDVCHMDIETAVRQNYTPISVPMNNLDMARQMDQQFRMIQLAMLANVWLNTVKPSYAPQNYALTNSSGSGRFDYKSIVDGQA